MLPVEDSRWAPESCHSGDILAFTRYPGYVPTARKGSATRDEGAISHAPDEQAALDRKDIALARAGDLAAFNRLVERYQRLAYNVAVRTLGQPDDAADAAQDAFVAAFRAIRELRGESFKAWLLRIVVNSCYDRLRRRQRQPAASLDQLAEQAGP